MGFLRVVLILSLFASGTVLASGGGGGSGVVKVVDPIVRAAQEAIASKDWRAAQGILKQGLEAKPNNADYHNLYAHAMRKSVKPDMEQVFNHYAATLRINPNHLGAHEYMGEAYLMVNDVASAREHLAALDKLC